MRADSHYIDHLDSQVPSVPLRLIDTHAIAMGHQPLDLPSAEFVDSIKRHGVLQPLIVMNRNGEYHVVAGRRRLAAAVTAGLRQVPCLVHRFDPDQAGDIAEAANLPATRPAPAPELTRPAGIDAARAELTQVLAGLMSSTTLLSNDSTLTQALAADLVRAETTRAMDLLIALGVLSEEMPMARVAVPMRPLLQRVSRGAAAGQRLRAIALQVNDAADTLVARGDEQLLATAVSGLVAAAMSLVEGITGASVTLTADAIGHRGVTVAVSQQAMAVPASWVAGAFDTAWPVRSGRGALVLMQSARKIAEAHGGSASAEAADGGTTFRLTLASFTG